MGIDWTPLYFDSMGVKSSSVLVKTPDVTILIDPGAAEMHPSYPLPWEIKMRYLNKDRKMIQEASKQADLIVISHYHYDHYSLLDTPGIDAVKLYEGKKIYMKNPNRYINESQWERSRHFLYQLFEKFGKTSLKEVMGESRNMKFPDPLDELPICSSIDWGSYTQRKMELLEKGRKWFNNLTNKYWRRNWIPEMEFDETKIFWADGKRIKIGKTEIIFSQPRFHGIEFDRVGWVFSTTIIHGGEKFIHTSDLEGVQIEDYKDAIIKENPDILVMDGPATYLFGFMINRINLNRSIENLCEVIKKSYFDWMILDHHLLRDHNYKKRLKKVYETAEKEEKRVLSVAEYFGKKPKILESIKKGN